MMLTSSNTPGYLFLLCGLLLSLISALVPHFEAGYKLMLSVFAAGILPYLVYGIAVPLWRNPVTTVTGLLLVVAHTWLVINQRFVAIVDYSDGMIYYIPAIISVALLPLALTAIKKSEKY
ncbi:MAG: hypothetical protein PVG45_03260 [Gammaproteobacteria bacterium]